MPVVGEGTVSLLQQVVSGLPRGENAAPSYMATSALWTAGEEPERVEVDGHGRFMSKDGVVQLAEPSEFDIHDVLQAAQRYNPANDVRDMRRLGKKQELKVRAREL